MLKNKSKITSSKNTTFPRLVEKFLPNLPKIGDALTGAVLSHLKNEIIVDLEGLGTGIIRGKELIDVAGDIKKLKEGDQIQAIVIDLENEKGHIELSVMQSSLNKAWEKIEQACKENKTIESKVIDANKGGLIVSAYGLASFLPVSQLTANHYPRVVDADKKKILKALKKFIGFNFKVKILNLNEDENKIIVSEKAANQENQQKILEKFKENEIVKVKIKALTKFGAFVDLGNKIEGLIHISELAWHKVESAKEVVKIGEEIKAKIINIINNKIFLSLKALQENPWEKFSKKYPVGNKIKGTIVKITPFGLLVEVNKNIQGLVHISQLIKANSETGPEDILKKFKLNQEKEFEILNIDPKQTKLALKLI